MSQDIRSFFKVISKKNSAEQPKQSGKTKPAVASSEDEDLVKNTPDQKRPKKTTKKRKVQVLSSDSEGESKPKEKPAAKSHKEQNKEPKLKPVNISDIFSNTPVRQSKVEYVPKSEPKVNEAAKNKKKRLKESAEAAVHADESFKKTLMELDDDFLIDNLDVIDKTINEAFDEVPTETPKGERDSTKDVRKPEKKSDSTRTVAKSEKTETASKTNATKSEKHEDFTKDEKDSPKHAKKRQRKTSEHVEDTPSKKKKLEHVDSGIDPDQERFEKRRYSAALYQQYLHRGGPKHHGAKELPKGKPDCLHNLTFLRTGVLDSLEGPEFENLVKEHGGRVVHTVSKKVNYVVVGDEPGPAKLEKARNYKIPTISEDELLDLILVKSGMKPHFAKKLSEDDGIASEDEISPEKSANQSKKDDDDKNSDGTSLKNKRDAKDSLTKSKTSKSEHSKKEHKTENSTHEEKLEKIKDKKRKEEEEACDTSHKVKLFPTNTSPKKLTSHSQDLPQINREITVTPNSSLAWTEKYKPTNIKTIIGQQDNNSNMNKLKNWLSRWSYNNRPEIRAKLVKPTPWNPGDGGYYKCALLSGPPGVGKTTTATLVSKELCFDVVEFNASDTRNKRLLHEQVSQLLSTKTIAGYAAGEQKTKKKRVLLMDEVDGMAGNEDRGGIQELISLIKNTKIPIICMCNDRNHQKMRTLVTYCYDLRFNKPSLQQIKGAMLSICFKEGLKIKPDAVSELISGTGCDIRQTLNHLAMWSADDKNLSLETVEKQSKSSKKDVVLGPWEVVKKVFSESEQKNMKLADKFRLFFFDYSMGPLFIQENYLNTSLNCSDKEKLIRASKAADSLSRGDLIESKIRGSNNWALLETQAFFSSVLPGHYMSGTLKVANFPSWLGKNSKKNKLNRMLSELHAHTRNCTSGSKLAMKLDYVTPLRDAIVTPLKREGMAGIPKAVAVMKAYNLLREDLNNLAELCHWGDAKNPFNDVESKVKAAFTRTYNKEVPMLPFASVSGVSKKRAAAVDDEALMGEETIESDDEDEDNIDLDAMIKKKTAKEKKDKAKAGTSKQKESKGKGKKK